MARASKNTALDSKAKRLKLPIQREPHWSKIDDGKHLGYRKTGDARGTWILRIYSKDQGRKFESLGIADDRAGEVGSDILSYSEALEAAKKAIKRLEGDVKAGVERSKTYTVADALTDYIADKEREKRKPQDRARQIADAHIVPKLGKIALHKLSHGQVKAWRDSLATQAPRIRTKAVTEKRMVSTMLHGEKVERVRDRATDKLQAQAFRDVDMDDPEVMRQRQASANRILTVLKAALNHAHQERKVSHKEAWEAVKPFRRVDVPKVRSLSADEVAVLVPACEVNFGKLVQAALLTGCRYGELAGMTVEAFNGETAQVYVAESKNGESRYVDLNEEGVAFFASMTANRDDAEPIFTKANGKPWMKSEQKRPIDAACESAGIEGVTFHILRHTYASHAVMNGMPIAVLSEQLGHKDTRITERHYAHLSKTYKQKLIRANAPSFGFAPVAALGPQLVSRVS